MKMVPQDYLSRKMGFYRLLKKQQLNRPTEPAGIREYQRETLDLIASYVRCHRDDTKGCEIFVNLLVEDGDDIVVVARNYDHRVVSARYAKSGMLAWRAISTGEPQYIGDARKELPGCADKPYRSILVIPIVGEDKVLGAVSIDSSQRFHFEGEAETLTRYLLPYVILLAWTLTSGKIEIRSEPTSTRGSP